jgi:hypothetical protein
VVGGEHGRNHTGWRLIANMVLDRTVTAGPLVATALSSVSQSLPCAYT